MQEEIQDKCDWERGGRKQSTELLVDTVSPWRTWPLSSKLFSRKIIPFGFGFKNCIANIFLFVKCRLCTRAEFKVSFYISEVSPLVISKYKNMQENYERWKMIIMIKRILYSELQLHVGRNTKPYRKKYKTQQEEKQNATRKKTKPCRKKNKTMQEEFQNHTRRNAKPFKKKYKAMQEEIQNHARRNTKYRGRTSSSRRAGPRGL